MYMKMFKNYIRKNKLVSVATCIFMAISAVFIGLTVLLSVSLLGSIDNLMTEAKTCDFLQMHSGDIDRVELHEFANSRSDVEDMLIANFLNIENSSISLNGIFLADSTQDNGLCIQNENFDHLLGTDNEILHPEAGTVPQKIVGIISSFSPEREEATITDTLNKPENILMHDKVNKKIVEVVAPILTKVAEQGVKDGIFDCDNIYERVRMILIVSNTLFGDYMISERDVIVFIDMVEKLLGAKPGTMDLIKQLIK